jgi:sigma-B regulation protein RsbU (phosphoserine phosphatase)
LLNLQLNNTTLLREINSLKTILYNLSDGVIVADLEGRLLLFNPAAERILGVDAEKLIPSEGTAAYGCYETDEVTPYPFKQLPLFRAIRGEKTEEELIFVKNPEKPSGVWISMCGIPLRDEEGAILGGMVVLRDSSEHRKIQKKITNYQLLSSAVEQTADSVVITDTHGIIEYVNPAFETTTGYSRSEALGKTPRILKSGRYDEEFYRNLWKEVLEGRPFRCTIVNKRKTGALYWAQQTITPIKGDNGNITHFVSVLKDITDLIEKKDQEAKLNIAREVQQRFYGIAASVPGYDIAGSATPADETGGDYFDFINLPDGSLCIAVGDICGHGIGAALMMAETRAFLRSIAIISSDVVEILTRVNQFLIPDLDDDEFVTLLLCRLDPHKRTLTYAGAGHAPSFLFDKSGEVDLTLGATGIPLGLFSDARFSSEVLRFSDPGQVLLLPTDGIMESKSPDETPFGDKRTIDYITSHRHETARQIVEGLHKAVKAHAENLRQLDDITAVVVKVI